jgi:hypothetical protein
LCPSEKHGKNINLAYELKAMAVGLGGDLAVGLQIQLSDFSKNKIKTYFKNVSHRCICKMNSNFKVKVKMKQAISCNYYR